MSRNEQLAVLDEYHINNKCCFNCHEKSLSTRKNESDASDSYESLEDRTTQKSSCLDEYYL